MNRNPIDEFTNQIMQKERFLSFYIWKSAQNYGYSLTKQEIEDIFSDSYLKAATKIQNTEEIELKYPLAWFTRIVFLTLMNFLRKKKHKTKAIDIQELEDLRMMNMVYETIDRHMNDDIIKKLMDKHLTEDEKKVVEMNVKGYSYEEISKALNRTQESVRQLKSRAIKKIKKLIN